MLFSADPVTGSRDQMSGNYVQGPGEALASGQATPHEFSVSRPRGCYDGPARLKRFARRLYRLAKRLEQDLGCPQDIEWAIAGRRLSLLQSRAVTTLVGFDAVTGCGRMEGRRFQSREGGDMLCARDPLGDTRLNLLPGPFLFEGPSSRHCPPRISRISTPSNPRSRTAI
jgi:hypothetical protein